MKIRIGVSIVFLIFHFLHISILSQSISYGFFYVSGSGQHGIYLAQKNPSGNWNRGSQLKINGQFNGNAVDPDVIKLTDGRYKIFYYKGYFVTPPPPNYKNHEIFSAVSNDGINYSSEEKVFEAEGITDPSVVQLNDGSYLMVCVRGNLLIFSKSSNGSSFQSTGITIPNVGIPELAKLENGNVRLFYNGPGGIVSSISSDGGSNWIKESGVRLPSNKFIADPSVIRISQNKWFLFVKGFNNTGAQNPSGHNVLLSESSDCYSFNFIESVLLDSASVPEGVVLENATDVSAQQFPNDFVLYQNFPNPFNPVTIISYQLAVNNWVTLKIYDQLGREVATLVDEFKPAGKYNCEWRIGSTIGGGELASGVYFCKLTAGNFCEVKKMVLMK